MYDTGWIDITTLGNNVTKYDGDRRPVVRRIGKKVYFRGVIKCSTSSTAHDSAMYIPSGFRPARTESFRCNGSGAYNFKTEIQPDGRVSILNVQSASTDNAKLSDSTFYWFTAEWLID